MPTQYSDHGLPEPTSGEYGKILKRRSFGIFQIWVLNLTTPLLRHLDSLLPIPPLSLIAVMGRPAIGHQTAVAPGDTKEGTRARDLIAVLLAVLNRDS